MEAEGLAAGYFNFFSSQPSLKLPLWLTSFMAGHFSTVIMELEQGSNSTELTLVQTGVPSDHFESTSENWHRFFWNQLKGVFGWGILN